MPAKILIALIRVYQSTLSRVLLALFGPVCRFEPSCSRYAVACLEGHGALRGSLLSVKRLCKCHPFHPGGYDPPPPPLDGRARTTGPGSTTGAPSRPGASVSSSVGAPAPSAAGAPHDAEAREGLADPAAG